MFLIEIKIIFHYFGFLHFYVLHIDNIDVKYCVPIILPIHHIKNAARS